MYEYLDSFIGQFLFYVIRCIPSELGISSKLIRRRCVYYS